MELKILKIKPWMVKFSIDGQKYFVKLVEECDEEPVLHLYGFDADKEGRYTLTYLKSAFAPGVAHYDSRTKQGETYESIDKDEFFEKLAADGFDEILGLPPYYRMRSDMRKLIEQHEEKSKQLESVLKEERTLEAELREIQRRIKELYEGGYR